jgi:uncharacterized membrane protein YhaH (DUF805 family)
MKMKKSNRFRRTSVTRLEKNLKVITIAITILVVISIAAEILFPEVAEANKLLIELVDFAFVGIILVDLALRYKRIGDRRLFLKKYWIDVVFLIVFVGVLRLLKNARLLKGAGSVIGEEAEIIRVSGISTTETPVLVGKIGKMSIHTVHIGRLTPLSKISKLFKIQKILSGKENEILVLREKILS